MSMREPRPIEASPARSFGDCYRKISSQKRPRTEKDELLLELYEQLHEKHSMPVPSAKL